MVAPVQARITAHAQAWEDAIPDYPSRAEDIPPLENGDRLTRREFERRYNAMPGLKKAELIEGVVYMPSPVRIDFHALQHSLVIGWLTVYYAATPNLILGDNATVRLDADNETQPDALLMIARGGQARVDEDGYVAGAPECVFEVASTSAAYDLHEKRNVYRRCGVKEYAVWRTRESALDWWRLVDGVYQPLPMDESGLVLSEVFPGLCLNVAALLRGDIAAVLETQRQALLREAHARFVERLRDLRA